MYVGVLNKQYQMQLILWLLPNDMRKMKNLSWTDSSCCWIKPKNVGLYLNKRNRFEWNQLLSNFIICIYTRRKNKIQILCIINQWDRTILHKRTRGGRRQKKQTSNGYWLRGFICYAVRENVRWIIIEWLKLTMVVYYNNIPL